MSVFHTLRIQIMTFWNHHALQGILQESLGDNGYVFPKPVFVDDIRFNDGGIRPLRLSHAPRFHHSTARHTDWLWRYAVSLTGELSGRVLSWTIQSTSPFE